MSDSLVIWTCVCQTEIVSVSSYGRECVRQSRHMDVCVCQTEIVSVSSYGRVCVRLR